VSGKLLKLKFRLMAVASVMELTRLGLPEVRHANCTAGELVFKAYF
jgi:hypothetical protein